MFGMKDIYNLLFAGKTLNLDFPSSREAEVFRVKMHQYKQRQDRNMIALGMLEQDEKQSFSFKYNAETSMATMQFVLGRARKTWNIVIVDTEDELEDVTNG